MRAGRGMAAGAAILGAAILAAWAAPWLAPYDPQAIRVPEALLPPSADHWFGTDQLGRDVFSRMLYGARVSMKVGVLAVGIATAAGIAIGAAAGYWGRKVDALLMRFVDIMLCFPTIFLILAAVALLEQSEWNLIVIIGLTGWMGVARLLRAEILSLKNREFILSARAIGASPLRIITRHLVPNALAPVAVNATLGIGAAILTESALSFLGIGIPVEIPSWGNLLTEGKETLGVAWWLTLFPGGAIFAVVMGCNLLGEGLRARWRG